MCRNASWCSELDQDPNNWSKDCPLPPPKYFEESLDFFIAAFRAANKGELDEAMYLLTQTRSDELRYWYVEHGQMSGWKYRTNALNAPKPLEFSGALETNKSFSKFESSVYNRDGYRCGYCSLKLIDTKALLKMEKLVGIQHFKVKGTNDERHGVALVLRATIDHIHPLSLGGRTSLENLVTSCWSCNYGKLNATLEQIGISNPLGRGIKEIDDWDGLRTDL
jgi:hypothetical protein